MNLLKIILVLMSLGICSVSHAQADGDGQQTEAQALSSGHQAGIVKGSNDPKPPVFGGYSNNRRGDRERALEIINEMRSKQVQTSDSETTK